MINNSQLPNEGGFTLQDTEDSSTKRVAYSIYILYFLSLVLPVLSIVGVVFGYIFTNDAKDYLKSHYQFLIRSFWIGLLYFSVAGLSIIIVIGLILVPLCIIWWIIRMTKGFKSLLRNQPLENPKTWWF